MTQQTEHSKYVNRTFINIAKHYDFMNRLMSGGADLRWRKEAIQLAEIKPADHVLDIGAGTGDLTRAARSSTLENELIASDFTYTMLTQKNDWHGIDRLNADALQMPFSDACFDVILSGFLLRNVGNVDNALQEQFRMLKPGGRVVVLDTTKPRKSLLLPFVNFYLNKVIPALGVVITGNKEAYTYLPRSTQNFLRAEALAEKLENAGFSQVRFRIRMFGSVAIHHAIKPL
jgi:demethylmenaquinone methyltransferase / 2-methoxy-6-polyprenyl-1,4-benzoquinol methylase